MTERSTWRRRGAVVLGVVLVALWFVWHDKLFARRTPAKAPPPVLVDVAAARRADVPVYLSGLGTVQAFFTVSVTPRVDGQIERVAFVEGQDVQRGQLLVQIDPRPYRAALDQARGVLAKDEATLANGRRDLTRYETLAPEQLASKQTLDTQRALVQQLEAQLISDRASVDSARTQLDYTSITSPINGRTGIRQIDPGNVVHAAATNAIVVVTQLQPIAVVFTLPEEQFAALSGALRQGAVDVEARVHDGAPVLDRGKVQLIDNQIDTTTGTIRVKAIFPNAQHQLWPGQFLSLRALQTMAHDVVTIPSAAIQHGPNGVFAYVVRADSSVAMTPLTLGEQSGDDVVVATGLTGGERVVTSNQYHPQPDAHVQIAPAKTAAATP